MDNEVIINAKKSPSLLRQIVDEADTLDEAGQEDILRKIKMQKALKLAQKADILLVGKFKELTEDELAEMVSENRKKYYAEKIRN
jgi:hypothetical protein